MEINRNRIKKHTKHTIDERRTEITKTKNALQTTAPVFACSFIAENRNKIIQSHENKTRDPKRPMSVSAAAYNSLSLSLTVQHTG